MSNQTTSPGSHAALEPSALSNGRVCLSSAMEHGFVGPLDIYPDAFHPDLIPVAKIAREARENGAKDFSDVLLYLIQTTEPGEKQDLLRSKIADVADEVPHRPEALEGSAVIVRHYDLVKRRQHLLWQMNTANDRGDSLDKILKQLAELESESPQGKPKASRFESLALGSRVVMEQYSTMEPHEARSLLPRELWKGILREGTLAILGGESKAKKSWFSLSFAMAAVASADFLGMAVSAPLDAPRRVRVLDFELLEGNVMSRFLAMSERFYSEEDHRAIWQQIEIFHHRELMTEAADWIGYAAWHCEQLSRGDLLIVDCLQALDVGENNDPGVIRRALGRLQAAATRSGVCILIVDHFNKSSEARGKNRLSGSMAKSATPDAIILLESDGPFIKLSFELRMDPPMDSLTLAFDSPSQGFRVVTTEEREERKEASAGSKREERLSLMFPDRGRRYSRVEIAANIGKSIKTAEAWIKELSDAIITHIQGGKNPHLYSLNYDS